MKAKIKCIGIIGKGLNPCAVITATIRKANVATTYVYAEHEERSELAFRLKEYSYDFRPLQGNGALVRTHAIDVETGKVDADRMSQSASWIGAESLWLRVKVNDTPTELASAIVTALNLWRKAYPENKSRIWAPNWHVLTLCRSVAMASGIPLESGVL